MNSLLQQTPAENRTAVDAIRFSRWIQLVLAIEVVHQVVFILNQRMPVRRSVLWVVGSHRFQDEISLVIIEYSFIHDVVERDSQFCSFASVGMDFFQMAAIVVDTAQTFKDGSKTLDV